MINSTSQQDAVKDMLYPHISSIEQNSVKYDWLFGVGALVGLGGVIGLIKSGDVYSIMALIIGAALIGVYYYTKRSGLVLITAAEKFNFDVAGNNANKIVKDVFKIVRGHK